MDPVDERILRIFVADHIAGRITGDPGVYLDGLIDYQLERAGWTNGFNRMASVVRMYVEDACPDILHPDDE